MNSLPKAMFIGHFGKGKIIGIETGQWFPGAWSQERLQKDMGIFGVMEMFCIFIVVIGTWLYMFFETHRTLHEKGFDSTQILPQ